jgi:hypothetical protein
VYSVKSAYNLGRTSSFFARQGNAGKVSISDNEWEAKMAKIMWALKAPPKMTFILCRFVHDYLPTGHQLRHWNIPTDDRCVFCGHSEQVEHLFVFCALS